MESSVVRKRILLIDDDPRVRASLKMVLEPIYDILQASDGHEGLDVFRKDEPDLILLDVILPGTDGLAVLQTLRRRNRAGTDHRSPNYSGASRRNSSSEYGRGRNDLPHQSSLPSGLERKERLWKARLSGNEFC